MSFQPPLYRVLLRSAVLVLLPLLCLAAWVLHGAWQQQRELERDSIDRLLHERVRSVQSRLEHTLDMAVFAATRLRRTPLREPAACAALLGDLLAMQPLVTAAALRDGAGHAVCAAGAAPPPPLPLATTLPWRLGALPDGSLQVDHLVQGDSRAVPGRLSLRLDAAGLGAPAEPGEAAGATRLQWLADPAAVPPAAAPPVRLVKLRGQPVATVELARAGGLPLPPGRLGLPAVLAAMLACTLLTMMVLLWLGHRLLRGESRRLMRVARYPEEGESIGARMVAGELAEAAGVIAAEQQRARALGEELRQATLRLEEVQRAASIGSWRMDLSSSRIEWSAQTHAIFGMPQHEAITLERLFSLVHPQDRAGLAEHHRALAAGLGDLDFAHRIERPGGEERVVHERGAVAARDAQGRPTALVGTVQDVTEAWEATSLNDALARVLALSEDPVLLTREHAGTWLRAWSNRAWDRLCEQLNLDGREADHQLFNPATGLLRTHAGRAREAQLQKKLLRLELVLDLPPGRRWYEVELMPQGGSAGRAGHGLLVLRDRSAERQAAEALRESNEQLERLVRQRTDALVRSEQQYRVLADLSPQILWQADRDGKVSYLNRTWYELVGARDGDWLGMRWTDALHPDDVAGSLQAMGTGVRTRQPWQVRRRVKDRAGAYRSFLGVAAPVLAADGQVEGWVGVDTDITELERRAHRLHQLNAELETFSYTVSHDLRAPVHVIKGFAQALLSGQVGKLDDEARSYLERMLRGAGRMDELISDLLDLARLSRETLVLRRFDPGALARSLVEAIQERYPGQVIDCHTSGGGLEIEADRRLFQVLLENLLDNAAKFSAGRPVCRIDLTWWREREEIVVEVADQGVGFPPELAHRLFQPYQRLHARKAFPGNGIGLATVARIVQLHDGTISAHNRPGGGAVFQIRLPLAVQPAGAGAAVTEAS
jgi:PAS domain S-box-containing protein